MRLLFLLLLLSLESFWVAASSNHSQAKPLDFDYSHNSALGPLNWRNINTTDNEWERYIGLNHINLDVVGNECKSKRRPSPINLVPNAECEDTHQILTRKIRPEDCKMNDLHFSINEHTLRADFPDNGQCELPTVDLPNGYPFQWLAHHIEVHIRAEHVVEGRRYDGEMQIWHLGMEDQKRELTVISTLFDASGVEDEPRLQEYIDRWEAVEQETLANCPQRRNLKRMRKSPRQAARIRSIHNSLRTTNSSVFYTQARRALDHPEHAITKRDLEFRKEDWAPRRRMFPYDIWTTIHFYRYKGSMTMPPCSEIISWRVLDEPLVISRRQLKTLARLMTDHVDPETCEKETRISPQGENVRPLQQLNHEKQELVHCTEKHFTHRLYAPEKQ